MKVTGKHRELLIELLLYYLNKNYPEMNYSSIIGSVKKRDAFGEHWIKHYIDNGNKHIKMIIKSARKSARKSASITL
jgi:hypothetical protein